MTKQEYMKQVARHLQCPLAKKREIVRQLDSHIEIGLGEGRELSEILEEMGEPQTIAADFNENMEESVKKKGKGKWVLLILAAVLLVLGIGAGYLYWVLPKGRDINKSAVFDVKEVEAASEEVILLFSNWENEKFDALLTDEMRKALEGTSFEEIREYVGEDWGELVNIGNPYLVEIVQRGRHFVVVQVNASYEKVSVTFTLSFNDEMLLYGFYVK